MLFWILSIVFLTLLVIGIYRDLMFIPLTFGLAGFGALMLLTAFGTYDVVEKRDTYQLAALGTGSETSDSFFLGTGSIDEEPVVQFVIKGNDGWNTIEQVKQSRSKIKEDTDNPHVTYVYTTKSNPWILPFEWNGNRTYEFNVPEDTIVNNYVIDVTK